MTKRQLEELLQHESFLRWLARRLLQDSARADDVVQETWLAVLHSNKSPSEVHRGWLAGVLRNLARRKLREERRRARREQLVARPHLSPPAPSRLDAEELRVQLAKLVLRLPEHYREALLLRYYEGLAPAEIAARTGVAASTVRTRIQRGLARIRTDLDGSAFSVAPLLHVIAAGKASRGVRLAPLAAAGVVIVAALSVLQGARAVHRAPTAAASVPSRAVDRPDGFIQARAPRAVERQGVVDGLVPARPAPTLTGHVQLPHGVVSESVGLEVTASGRAAVVRVKVRDRFQADLSPLFESGTPASLQVSATHPECEPVTRRLSANAREIAIVLQRRPLFEPELLVPPLPEEDADSTQPDATKAPRRGFALTIPVYLTTTVHLPDSVASEPIALAVCRDGRCLRFRLPPGRRARVDVGALLNGAPTSRLVVRAASRNTVATSRTIPVWSGPRLDPLVLRLERGRLVRGQVAWEQGAAGSGATVAAIDRTRGATVPLVATTADAAGRFELTLPGDRALTLLAVASGAMPVSAAPAEEVRLVLRSGATVTGLVKGQPHRARVRLFASGAMRGTRTRSGTVMWAASGPRWSALSTRSDDGGRFRFAGLEAGVYTARCAGAKREVTAPGHIELAPRRMDLTVVMSDAGAPLGNARLTVGDRSLLTDAAGRATMMVLEGADLSIRADAPGYPPVERDLSSGEELSMELTRIGQLGRLEILVAPGGAPLLASARVTLRAVGRQ
ncbi:MAG: RNA polymerase sigma factor, partial [Planctomycetota bacterium]